jgi:hypothetical protein
MPTRKLIGPNKLKNCYSSEHYPPSMQVFEPGTYEHQCPACGQKTYFSVAGYTMNGGRTPDGYTVTVERPLVKDEFDRFKKSLMGAEK